MNKLKDLFNYRKRWKHQKNRNKLLVKKINKMETSLAEDLRLDITNDEIRKLKQQVNDLKNQVKKLNLEAQKYFDMLMKKESIDSIVCDPPYELNFMNKGWDNVGISFDKKTWKKCYEVLKPGGYLLAFGGSRTYHRIACAIEDAGFEIRDTIMWLYGSGFPKSMNIGLAIDKKNGVESIDTGIQSPNARPNCDKTNTLYESGTVGKNFTIKKATNKWHGWGTALKPSFEPIIVARKPFKGSLVDNVIKNGVGGLNIDECRVGNELIKGGTMPDFRDIGEKSKEAIGIDKLSFGQVENAKRKPLDDHVGRFPANTILTYDETDFEEVCGGFPNTKSTKTNSQLLDIRGNNYNNANKTLNISYERGFNDSGSASRYFYCAKASKKDRDEGLDNFDKEKVNDGRNTTIDNDFQRGETLRKNTHPTVKPTTLMQYLVRLVSPKGSIILDPFNGSGSTGKAVMYENKERNANYKYIGIELTEEYLPIAKARIEYVCNLKEEENQNKQLSIFDNI